jgi:hypothetical protein
MDREDIGEYQLITNKGYWYLLSLINHFQTQLMLFATWQ